MKVNNFRNYVSFLLQKLQGFINGRILLQRCNIHNPNEIYSLIIYKYKIVQNILLCMRKSLDIILPMGNLYDTMVQLGNFWILCFV